MKKRVLLLAAIVALIAGAGIAYAASSTGGGLPGGEPAVWGGGHVDWGPDFGGVQRDFSIVATPDGGEYLYGHFGQGVTHDVRVTCMNVSRDVLGNSAVLGGTNGQDLFIWFVMDDGKMATTPDRVSGLYILTKADLGWGGTTKYFPYVCPSWSTIPWNEVPMFDMTSGDIVVQRATQNSQQ